MAQEVTFGRQLSPSDQILNALGSAYGTSLLYPNPEAQPAFVRALEILKLLSGAPMTFEVGPAVFLHEGEEIGKGRDAVEKLAKRLFIHDVEAVRLTGPPTGDHLIQLFELLERDEAEVAGEGGLTAQMVGAGITTIGVRLRGRLEHAVGGSEAEGDGDVSGPIAASHRDGVPTFDKAAPTAHPIDFDPTAMSEGMMRAAGEQGGDLAMLFVDTFEATMAGVENGDLTGRQRAVQNFVDTFFALEGEASTQVLGKFLSRYDSKIHQAFLDQFSGSDLAAFTASLDDVAKESLYEYARVAADDSGDRSEELVDALQSAEAVRRARDAVDARIGQMLEEGSNFATIAGAFESIRAQLGELPADRELAERVMSGLFEAERRESRFKRIVRIWTTRVLRAIEDGDLVSAQGLLSAVTTERRFPLEFAPFVDQALTDLINSDLIDPLIDQFLSEPTAGSRDLLRTFGKAGVEAIIELLADEENPSRRRALTDMLATVGRDDTSLIVEHLGDSRWYVVRNLAIALGKTNRHSAAGALNQLMEHSDHRVRTEALRSIVALSGDQATVTLTRALSDSHERVREAALALLSGRGSEIVDKELVASLESGNLHVDEQVRVVNTLASRATPVAVEAIERLAAKRFVIWHKDRVVRDAAKAAQKKQTRVHS